MIHQISTLCECTSSNDCIEPENLGMKFIGCALASVLLVIIFIYSVYKLYICKESSNVHWGSHMLLVLSEAVGLLYLFSALIRFIFPMFNVDNIYDMSSIIVCYNNTLLNLFFLGTFHLCCAPYWLLRLKLVFAGTKYQSSNKFYFIMIIWIAFGAITGLGIVITGISIVSSDKSNQNDKFCVGKVKIQDFFPYLYHQTNDEYKYKINNFYKCDKNSDDSMWILIDVATYIGVACIPTINFILFYQYVSKWRQIAIDNAKNNNDKHDDDNQYELAQFMHIYQNGILGIASIGTTFLAAIGQVIDSNMFGFLFFFDVILNVLFMIMVLQFGQWLFYACCNSVIMRLYARKYKEKGTVELQKVASANE